MEKRQLDFSVPLMSTRRYSSPSKFSELVKLKVVEKPPPCRQQSLQHNKPDWESELTKPAAVPFQWEHTPGRPKGEVESHSHTPEESNTPRLPPGRVFRERSRDQNMYRPQKDAIAFAHHATLLEKLNDSLSRGDDSDTESGDDAYLDALDTLSQTESCLFDCSVSGISGGQSSGVKPSRTFRDFMMNRFLPSAKAVLRGTLEYAVNKPSMLKKKPSEEVKKAVTGEMKPPLRQYGPDVLPRYTHCVYNVESEDEDQESSALKKKRSGKTWGLLIHYCVRNSLCLLNSLPALRLKPKIHAPLPSKREVNRMTRNAHSGPLAKNACHVVNKKKFHSGQLLNSIDSHGSAGASPLIHYRSGNISPYRNESPKSPFREGVGFLDLHKEVEAFNPKIASSRKMSKSLQHLSRYQNKTPKEDYVKKKNLSSTKPFHMRDEEVVDALKANTLGEGEKLSPISDAMDGGKLIQRLNKEPNNEVDCDEESKEGENGRELYPLMESSLSPPLPKSPSEPWLWRTSSLLHQKMQGQKVSSANTKWATIVKKTSNSRQNHIHYSEELHRAAYRRMK